MKRSDLNKQFQKLPSQKNNSFFDYSEYIEWLEKQLVIYHKMVHDQQDSISSLLSTKNYK